MMIVAVAAFVLMASSCLRQDYLMFEDGDFDGMEFSDYDLMHNAELEMDDVDRDWRGSQGVSTSLYRSAISDLKIINRAVSREC